MNARSAHIELFRSHGLSESRVVPSAPDSARRTRVDARPRKLLLVIVAAGVGIVGPDVRLILLKVRARARPRPGRGTAWPGVPAGSCTSGARSVVSAGRLYIRGAMEALYLTDLAAADVSCLPGAYCCMCATRPQAS